MNWNPDTETSRRGGNPGRGRRGAPYDSERGRGHHPGRRGEFPGDHPRPGGGPRDGGPRDGGPRDRGPRDGGPRGGRPEGDRRRRGRGSRRDVRGAVLAMLATEPMHGYQLMQAIAERSNGNWSPSPGAVYPVLAQLEDEGLATVANEGGRKVATLTEAGQLAATEQADPFAGDDSESPGPDLRELVHSVAEASRQVGRTGSTAQRTRAAELLTETRRSLYLILAEAPDVE